MPTYIPITDPEVAAEQPITVSLMTRLRDNTLSYWGAPINTIALAGNTSAPVGWTKLSDFDNVALRVTSGAVGSGGVQNFTTVFGKTATDNYTIVLADLPNSTRPVTLSGNVQVRNAGGTAMLGVNSAVGGTLVVAGGAISVFITGVYEGLLTNLAEGSGSMTLGGSSNPHAHPMDIRVRYVDVIRIQKQ